MKAWISHVMAGLAGAAATYAILSPSPSQTTPVHASAAVRPPPWQGARNAERTEWLAPPEARETPVETQERAAVVAADSPDPMDHRSQREALRAHRDSYEKLRRDGTIRRLVSRLDLSDAQKAAMDKFLADTARAKQDAMDAVEAGGDPAAHADILSENADPLADWVATHLGQSQMEKFSAYREERRRNIAELSAQQEVSELGAQLALSEAQKDALFDKIALNFLANPIDPSLLDQEGHVFLRGADNHGLDGPTMQSILSPEQYQAYLNQQKDKQAEIEAYSVDTHR